MSRMNASEFRALQASKNRQKRNKYGAKRTEVDGVTFDSQAEAIYIQELKILERQNIIRDLELQRVFPLVVNEIRIGEYRADAVFFDIENDRTRVHDVKGGDATATKEFKLKAKLMLALYGIVVEIIKR